jgi:hypothetical protein
MNDGGKYRFDNRFPGRTQDSSARDVIQWLKDGHDFEWCVKRVMRKNREWSRENVERWLRWVISQK